MPHCKVHFVPDERTESERFTAQWSGVLFRYNNGDPAGSDASNRFDFNTGNTSVEVMKYAHPDPGP